MWQIESGVEMSYDDQFQEKKQEIEILSPCPLSELSLPVSRCEESLP